MDGVIAYALAKKYTDKAISSGSNFDIKVEQDRSILNKQGLEKTFYFLPKNTSSTSNTYDEYMYINNKWEVVGSTDIDMSEYATKGWVESLLKDSTANIDVNGHLIINFAGTPIDCGLVRGTNGIDGKDGIGVTNAEINDEGHLIITLSNGNIIDAGPVVPETASDQGVFGVVYDYSLVSPVLERLTKQTDPLHLVTKTVTTEPTACIGTEGGQSEFDNFFPWKGIERKNYVNGKIVNFVGYDNGETYIYIPEFWFKVVDDLEHSKTYFYISSEEKEGFEKHAGSGRYIGRYLCDSDYKSTSGGSPKNRMSPSQFRTNISSIDNNHFQWDIHSYSAICLLYIVEFANLNSQLMIGEGNTSYKNLQNSGQTDILIYHTGRVAGENADSAVQYRWIENLWGNYANFIDGILLQNKEVYYCPTVSNYSDTITENYIDTQTLVDTGYSGKVSTFSGCIIPTSPIANSSSSMGLCDYNIINGDLQAVQAGGNISNINGNAGLFMWQSLATTGAPSYASSRPMIIVGGGS